MKTKQVMVWIPETKSFLALTFEKEYDAEEVKKTINGYYQEYINPDKAGVDEEMLDEIETTTPFRWIVDHMYNCEDYEIKSAKSVYVSDDVAKIIEYLKEKVAENKTYCEEYDDCDGHDAGVVMETAQDVLDFIEKEVAKYEEGKIPVAQNPNFREITREEFMALKVGDTVYSNCGRIPSFSSMRVTRVPFWNSDADEPGWEVETDDGFYDMYSLYVAVADYPKQSETEIKENDVVPEVKKVVWESEFEPNTKYPFCPYCKELAYERDHCVFCGKPYEWVENEGKTTTVEVGEYTIVQTSNHHIHIVKDGRIVMHAQCDKRLTEEELKKEVEFYKNL